MPTYRLRTFGRLSLERDGLEAGLLANQRKALALLALLAASGRAGVGREQVMALLWSESDTERARGSLKQLLHLLRRQLGHADAIVGQADLRLNAEFVDDDVGAFREALRAGEDARAVALYDGPFLQGVYVDGADEFERWAASERGELARLHAEALERLATAADALGKRDDALAWWRRLQALDPLNGRIAAGLMRALDASGDRAGALRHARAHQALLHEELDAAPDAQVVSLAEQLKERDSGGGARAIAERTREYSPERDLEQETSSTRDAEHPTPPTSHGPPAVTPGRASRFGGLRSRGPSSSSREWLPSFGARHPQRTTHRSFHGALRSPSCSIAPVNRRWTHSA